MRPARRWRCGSSRTARRSTSTPTATRRPAAGPRRSGSARSSSRPRSSPGRDRRRRQCDRRLGAVELRAEQHQRRCLGEPVHARGRLEQRRSGSRTAPAMPATRRSPSTAAAMRSSCSSRRPAAAEHRRQPLRERRGLGHGRADRDRCHRRRRAPQIAMDAAGNATAVWACSLEAGRLPLRRLGQPLQRRLGLGHGRPDRERNTTSATQAPQVAVDGAGNAIAVWHGPTAPGTASGRAVMSPAAAGTRRCCSRPTTPTAPATRRSPSTPAATRWRSGSSRTGSQQRPRQPLRRRPGLGHGDADRDRQRRLGAGGADRVRWGRQRDRGLGAPQHRRLQRPFGPTAGPSAPGGHVGADRRHAQLERGCRSSASTGSAM